MKSSSLKSSKKNSIRKDAEENQRIDNAMAIIDGAKEKARHQREEYAKYLRWKVKMQRKELKQHAKEEQKQRELFENHLAEVLHEHREQKKRDAKSYYEPTQPKTTASLERADNDSIPYEKLDTVVHSGYADNSSIPANRITLQEVQGGGVVAPPRMPWNTNYYGVRRKYRRHTDKAAESGKSGGGVGGGHSPGTGMDRIKEKITFEDVLKLPNILDNLGAAAPTDNGPSSATQGRRAAQTAPASISPLKRYPPNTIHIKPPSTKVSLKERFNRQQKVEAMFEKAVLRRQYATQRLMEDPPVDYMGGAENDLLRYIPMDLLLPETKPITDPAANQPGEEFFLTAMTKEEAEEYVQQQKKKSARRVGRHYFKLGPEALLGVPTAAQQGKKGKGGGGSGGKQAEDESPSASKKWQDLQNLQYYLNHVENYTKLYSRADTQVGKKYNWTRQDQHTLPTKVPEATYNLSTA